MLDYFKGNDISIKNGTDVNFVMRDMMSVFLEGVLDEELDEKLGYSKYDYRNKNTDNSRNGHSQKNMHTIFGDMKIAIARDRSGEYEPQDFLIVKEWQEGPLEEVYAVVFMDVIQYHVRSKKRVVKRAVYLSLGIDMNGKKDVLGMYVGENESAKFWLSTMNG